MRSLDVCDNVQSTDEYSDKRSEPTNFIYWNAQFRGDKVPDLSGIPDLGLCSCLVSGLGLLN